MIRNRRNPESGMIAGEQGRRAVGGPRGLCIAGLRGGGLLLLALVAVGCAGGGATYEKQDYILDAVRPGAPIQAPLDGTLAVNHFSVDAAFAGKGLVYRLGAFRYETDAYRQFLVPPGTMITEQTRTWLAQSGLFTHVLPAGSRIPSDYTLEANVTALYGDFANAASTAVMEIRFFLLRITDVNETVVFARTYRAATPVRDRTAKVFLAAMNESLVDILTRLEADLHEFLADRARKHKPTGS